MVKIREGLPLVDGQTTQADSATLAAQLVASQRSHQSAIAMPKFPSTSNTSWQLTSYILLLIAQPHTLIICMTLTLKTSIWMIPMCYQTKSLRRST